MSKECLSNAVIICAYHIQFKSFVWAKNKFYFLQFTLTHKINWAPIVSFYFEISNRNRFVFRRIVHD